MLSASSEASAQSLLPGHSDWQLIEAPNVEGAAVLLSADPEIRTGIWIYTDGGFLPEHSAAFSMLRAQHPLVQWLALLPSAGIHDDALAAHVAQHFLDYLTAPVDTGRLYLAAGHAEGMSRLVERAIGKLASCVRDQQMVGTSSAMVQLFRLIRKVAASDAPVFISGETGTGKELAALAIHERSLRSAGPFVAVDCAAIPPTLIHSELFGYEKGAFTGASQRKIGRIESAEGGTLFLDEIADLPLELQGNLLRFLQQSTIHRVGGTQPICVNARVIAATHMNLEEAAKQGRFREDLYFRLNVLRIQVPALRERDGDIEILARHFLTHFAKESGKPVRGYTKNALEQMRRYRWPGNIRELINRVRRAIVMADGQWISDQDLDLSETTIAPSQALQLGSARDVAEREAVQRAIRLSSDNYSAAARLLGVSRPTLYRLLGKHGELVLERRDQ